MVEEYIKNLNNYSINDKEKEIIDSFLSVIKKRKIDIYNPKDKEYFENIIKSIIECELGEHTNLVINFNDIDNYVGEFNYIREYNKEKRKYENTLLSISFSNSSIIVECLNDDIKRRLFAFKQILKCIYHELEHYKQFMRITSNISDRDSLLFAKDYIFSDEVLDKKTSLDTRKVYLMNHDNMAIESDANNNAFKKLIWYTDLDYVRNLDQINVTSIDFYISDLIIEENNKFYRYDRVEYINSNVDEIVKNNPYLIQKFPILNKEYNKDGSKKDLLSLIISMYSEISYFDSLEINNKDKTILIQNMLNMYYELIYNSLRITNDEDIKRLIDLIGKENYLNLLNNIKNLFRNDRIIRSNLSKRKYMLKNKLDSKYNYLKRLGIREKISHFENGIERKYDLEEYKKFIEFTNNESINKIMERYLIQRIPSRGYFILKDGKKIDANTLFKEKIIKELKSDMFLKDIIEVFKKYVKSSSESDYQIELERINSIYQKKISFIETLYNNALYDTKSKKS